MSSIFRIQKTENYVVLDKGFLNNNELSWQAKGLLAYMLSMPNDWTFNVTDLATRSKNGRDATNNIIKELCAAGYVQKQQKRAAGKFGSTEFFVFETPQPLTEKPSTGNQSTAPPLTENPLTEKPFTENPQLLSNNKLNNNLLNKDNDDEDKATPPAPVNPKIEIAYSFYQENGFGVLASHVNQKIGFWIDDLSEELVIHAMKLAIENNAMRWNYVEKILKDWFSKKFKTLADVEADRLRFEAERIRKQQQQNMPARNNASRNYGRGRQENVPEWFKTRNEPAPVESPPVVQENAEIDFEAERQKILKKLGNR